LQPLLGQRNPCWGTIYAVHRQSSLAKGEHMPSASTSNIKNSHRSMLEKHISQMQDILVRMREDYSLASKNGIPDGRLVLHHRPFP